MKSSFVKKVSFIFGALIMLFPILSVIFLGLAWSIVNNINGDSLKTQSINPPHFNPICSAKKTVEKTIENYFEQ